MCTTRAHFFLFGLAETSHPRLNKNTSKVDGEDVFKVIAIQWWQW
jgi:hypothetical protein